MEIFDNLQKKVEETYYYLDEMVSYNHFPAHPLTSFHRILLGNRKQRTSIRSQWQSSE